MKKIFQYLSTLLLILMVGTSCEEGNDNWRIITEAQTGSYIVGDATIYSAAATSAQLTPAALDGAPEGTQVVGIYTWLKSAGSFQILEVDAEGNQVAYGKGDVVASSPAETVKMAAGGSFQVAADGLYYVALNKADQEVTIIPVNFGIIGDATEQAWNGETSMGTASYDGTRFTVTFNMEGATLDKKQMKFRYSGNWGFEIPYQGAKVKIHTNMGGPAAGAITEAYAECKAGGENFSVGKAGIYTVSLQLDLRSAKFSAKAVCTAEDTSSAELPEKMFINGDAFSQDWNWDAAPEMIPVAGQDGCFWGIYYMKAGQGMKFNHERSWDTGENFGAENSDQKGFGEYPAGGANLTVDHDGYYMITVICSLSADKKSVEKKIILAEPKVYMCGDCAGGVWPGAEKGIAFELMGDEFQATTVAAGELRMYADLTVGDWWAHEFIILEGKIAYRGKGGDQERVQVEAGAVVKLNFKTNTGSIN